MEVRREGKADAHPCETRAHPMRRTLVDSLGERSEIVRPGKVERAREDSAAGRILRMSQRRVARCRENGTWHSVSAAGSGSPRKNQPRPWRGSGHSSATPARSPRWRVMSCNRERSHPLPALASPACRRRSSRAPRPLPIRGSELQRGRARNDLRSPATKSQPALPLPNERRSLGARATRYLSWLEKPVASNTRGAAAGSGELSTCRRASFPVSRA